MAGLQAVNFLRLSGLDVGLLKNIWNVADSRQLHYLQREVSHALLFTNMGGIDGCVIGLVMICGVGDGRISMWQ